MSDWIADWWEALTSQLESDAVRLSVSVKKNPFVLEKSTAVQVNRLCLIPQLEAERVKVVYSHSESGIDQMDKTEILKLRVNESLDIEASVDRQAFSSIAELSCHLLRGVLSPPESVRRSPWAW
jgi:hypothetical protein